MNCSLVQTESHKVPRRDGAEQKKRIIEDYVLPHEPGAIIAEWVLDASPSLFGGAERYLTGAFQIQDGART